jgi:hypothetical protein
VGRFEPAVAVALLLTACSTLSAGPSVPESVPSLDLDVTPVADAPDPAERGGAAALHVDCRFGIAQAGWSQDAGPAGPPRGEPVEALRDFIDMWAIPVPAGDFALAGTDVARLLYTHSTAQSPKIAVVVRHTEGGPDGDGWSMEVFAACDRAELDPAYDEPLRIWVDAEGRRAPTLEITAYPGAEHCDWEDVIYLNYEERTYLGGDVPSELVPSLVTAPERDIDLPPDAVDTGFTSGDTDLWLSADESIAYLVSPTHLDGFALAIAPVWCA